MLIFGLLVIFCTCPIYIVQPHEIDYELRNSPLQCGPDQYLETCASPCPLTCGNIANPPTCSAMCTLDCMCINNNYLFDAYSGRCVPREYCPLMVNRYRYNQTYYTIKFNEPTCDGVIIVHDKSGCYCSGGFVLNRLNGKCVFPMDCPKHPKDQVCPNNEYVNSCKNPCEPTCRDPREKTCPTTQCIYGCSCIKGLVRDESTGRCLKQYYCPNIQTTEPTQRCGKNEEFGTCGPQSEPTCYWPQATCNLPCRKGCFCKTGYIKSSEDGECVPEWVCSYIRTV